MPEQGAREAVRCFAAAVSVEHHSQCVPFSFERVQLRVEVGDQRLEICSEVVPRLAVVSGADHRRDGAERHTRPGQPADAHQTHEVLQRVHAVPVGGPRWFRQQPEPVIVPDRAHGRVCRRGQFADSHGSSINPDVTSGSSSTTGERALRPRDGRAGRRWSPSRCTHR